VGGKRAAILASLRGLPEKVAFPNWPPVERYGLGKIGGRRGVEKAVEREFGPSDRLVPMVD